MLILFFTLILWYYDTEEVLNMDFRKLAEERKDEFLQDLNTLVSIESTRDFSTKAENAPFGTNCRKVLDEMLAMAKRDGFETKDVDGYAGVITYGDQEETFGILGHLDIVPLGEDWTKDPLKVTESKGYIFGRGVMDDKGPSLAAYYALRIIKELNIPLKKRVMLIAGCDEESGMECMKYYVKHEEIPQMGFVPDADFPVIYGEKGQAQVVLHSEDATVIQKLVAGERSNIVIGKADCTLTSMSEKQKEQFEFYLQTNDLTGSIAEKDGNVVLHIDGVFSHAAQPYNGVNAAVHLLNFVGQAYDDQLARDLYAVLKDWQGKPVGIDINGMYMGFLTMNPGIVTIENGTADVLIDIRYPNDTNPDKIMKGFNEACTALSSNITASLKHFSKPLFVDPNSELVKQLMSVYQKYTGDTFSCPITIGGGTYARKFENFVSFGPELPNEVIETDEFVGGCHQRDEGIKLANLLQAIAIYADAIVSLAG